MFYKYYILQVQFRFVPNEIFVYLHACIHGSMFSAKVADLLRPFIRFTDFANEALVQLLLYGDNDLPNDISRTILQLALRFIHEFMKQDVLARTYGIQCHMWLPPILEKYLK